MFFSQMHITSQLQCTTIHPTLGHINNLELRRKGSNITLQVHSHTSHHQQHDSWDKTRILYFGLIGS